MIALLWNLFELAATIFEEFVIIRFICKFLNHDFSSAHGRIVYACGSVVGSAVVMLVDYFAGYEVWLGAVYTAYWFTFALIFLKGKWTSKLFAVLLANMILLCVSTIVSTSVTSIFSSNVDAVYSEQGFSRFLGICMQQICLIYFYSLILKLIDKTLLFRHKREWMLILSVFLISFFSLVLMHMAFYKADPTTIRPELLLLSEIGIVSLNIICLYMTISLSESNKETEELRIKEQRREYGIQYAETIQKQYEEIRNMRHDMKQHFSVIQRLQFEGNDRGVIDYTAECTEKIEKLDVFVNVGNEFVNAILNTKLSMAKSMGIEVICSSSNDISGVKDYDLCTLLGNILDNAIEGTQDVTVGRFIDVSLASDAYKLNICVSNSIGESVLEKNRELKSSKCNRHSHGRGVKSIRSMAERYNGSADFYEEGLIFFCHVVLYKNLSA